MAKWSLEGDAAVLRTIEEGPTIPPPDLPTVGAVFEKPLGGDISARIKEAAARAKSRHNGPATTLQVDTVGFAASGLRVTDAAGLIIEDRLDSARKLIKEQKFKEALTVLIAFLHDRRSDPTGIYLKAFCECHLGNPEDALRTLAPVIRTTPPALDSQVRQLRADIRESMLDDVLSETFAFIVENEAAKAVRRIEDLLNLDPEVPIYHCLRAHALLIGGHLPQARAAIDAAIPFCRGADGEMLEQLQQTVLRRMLENALEPARLHYRASDYRRARKALEQIKSEWGGQALWQTFYADLQALGGGLLSRAKRPSDVKPIGEFRTVDQLHFLLVREELEGGKRLLNDGEPDQATTVLMHGNSLAPFFPYLQYMIGQAMYLTVLMAMAMGKRLSLEDIDSRLDTALKFAVFGAEDPEIAAATGLVDAIQVARQAIAEVREQQARIQRDVSLVRPLGDEFVAIMKSAENGITSIEHFKDLQRRLKAIQKSAPGVKRNLNTDEGRESLMQLCNAAEQNLQQLAKMEPDMRVAEGVLELQQRLKTIMENLKPGSQGLQQARTSLRTLKDDVNAFLRGRDLPQEAKKVLNDLISTINGYLNQLAEAEILNPFVERFQSAFSVLDGRTTPLARYEAKHLRDEMTKLVTESASLLGRVTGAESKQTVEKIRNIAMDIVSKIPC